LATEILPATFAVLGADQVSPFWAVLTYFIFIMFGIAQQLAIWHCVITGIMAIKPKVLKKWESTITFFSCACGFILGLPMATEVNNWKNYLQHLDLKHISAGYLRGILYGLHLRKYLVACYRSANANYGCVSG